jgi:hypothetical protein
MQAKRSPVEHGMNVVAEQQEADHRTWRRIADTPAAPAIVPVRGWCSNSGLALRDRPRTPRAHLAWFRSLGNAEQHRSWLAILAVLVTDLAGSRVAAAINIAHHA